MINGKIATFLVSSLVVLGTLACGVTAATTPPAPTATPAPLNLVKVAEWEGRHTRNTETFRINSDQWTLTWAMEPDREVGWAIFTVWVHQADGTPVHMIQAQTGDSNSTMLRGSGDYYLAIEAGMEPNYIIRVSEFQ